MHLLHFYVVFSYTLQVTAGDGFWLAHTLIGVDVADFNDNIPK